MHKYRSLHVRQRGYALAVSVLRATDATSHPRTWAVLDQLRRAAVSVPANIAEGYGLGSRTQFHRHLRIALGSAAETETLMDLAEDCGYLRGDMLTDLRLKLDASIATLHGVLRSGRGKPPEH